MAFVTALVAAIGLTGFAATVATFAIKTVLSIGISKLLGNRAGKMGAGAQPAGSRQQLPPATDNKLPVIYGTAFVGPSITDAKISSDNKTMWYVCTFAEVTDTTAGSGYTFDQIFYDGKLVTFDGTDPAKVVSLTTNGDPPQVDTKIAGNIFIYLFPNGSSSGTNTGGQTAIQLLSDASIPSDQRWNGPIYTTGGQSATMTNTCFAIVKVIYNQDAGTTSLGQVQAKLTNAISGNPIKPGAVIKDYMLNTRYGCAIPLAQIDTDSLDDLDTYSDGLIDYTDDTGNPAQQVRYRINGPLDTGTDCLSNLQQLVDACDSWLQYSELTGKWSVVLNKSYLQSPNIQTINDLFIVNDDNLIGGIDISPVDLNGTFNQLEVQYPNTNIKDQTDYSYIDLFTEYPALVNTNEPVNKLNVQFQIVNNYVQATYLGIRRLLQSREDLVIAFQLDYSGIQLDAGDIVRVYSDVYGWNSAGGFADGKLFRVSNVVEQKYEDGSLGAAIQAFEYSEDIYDDDLDITDFVPSDNTGLVDPNIITQPDPPTIVVDSANTTYNMTVTGVVPTGGLVYYLDFNVGNSSNSANHLYYSSVNNANGAALLANTSISITSNDLPPDTLYWSVTAKNNQVGVRSNASASVSWPGSGVTEFDANANVGGITGNNIQSNTVTSNNMTTTGVVANTYNIGSASITVDDAGRISNLVGGNAFTEVEFNGNVVSNDASILNFTGNGVSNVTVANNIVTIDISGGSGGITVVDGDTSNQTSNATVINFIGNGVSVANVGNGQANVTVTTTSPFILDTGGNLAFTWLIPGTTASNANSVLFPSFTTLVNRNRGLLIPGEVLMYDSTPNAPVQSWTVGSYTQTANDWYPLYQNSATTANGFLANSTGPWQPANAQWQASVIRTVAPGQSKLDGAFGWVNIMGKQATTANGIEQLKFDSRFQVVADVDTTIQYGPAVQFIVDANVSIDTDGPYVYWPAVTTVDLVANRPQELYCNYYMQGNTFVQSNNTIIWSMGVVVKNPTANSNLYVTGGSFTIEEPVGFTYRNSYGG